MYLSYLKKFDFNSPKSYNKIKIFGGVILIFRKIKLNNVDFQIEFEIQNHCPFCGAYNEPIKIADMNNIKNDTPLKIISIIFKTTCCERYFSSFYIYNQIPLGSTRILSTYPTIDTEPLQPEFNIISENFVKIYNQARTASKLGNFELACIGYRTSIEFLLKDFLINVRKQDKKTISPTSLADIISYFEEKEISVSADVVRIFGNDKTHYIAKYDFDIKQVELYLEFLMATIRKEYLLANPPVQRK